MDRVLSIIGMEKYVKNAPAQNIKGIDKDDIKFSPNQKFIVADNGDVKAAFRCGFGGNVFLQALLKEN